MIANTFSGWAKWIEGDLGVSILNENDSNRGEEIIIFVKTVATLYSKYMQERKEGENRYLIQSIDNRNQLHIDILLR